MKNILNIKLISKITGRYVWNEGKEYYIDPSWRTRNEAIDICEEVGMEVSWFDFGSVSDMKWAWNPKRSDECFFRNQALGKREYCQVICSIQDETSKV